MGESWCTCFPCCYTNGGAALVCGVLGGWERGGLRWSGGLVEEVVVNLLWAMEWCFLKRGISFYDGEGFEVRIWVGRWWKWLLGSLSAVGVVECQHLFL